MLELSLRWLETRFLWEPALRWGRSILKLDSAAERDFGRRILGRTGQDQGGSSGNRKAKCGVHSNSPKHITWGNSKLDKRAKVFSRAGPRMANSVTKFKFWEKHSSTGNKVTLEEKTSRAAEIAGALCNHSKWLTHNRSLRRQDLEGLRLKITDYTLDTDLNDAITRYYTLLKMTFDMVNVYKIFETPETQVMRMLAVIASKPQVIPQLAKTKIAHADSECGKCGHITKFQLNLGEHSSSQTWISRLPRCDKRFQVRTMWNGQQFNASSLADRGSIR